MMLLIKNLIYLLTLILYKIQLIITYLNNVELTVMIIVDINVNNNTQKANNIINKNNVFIYKIFYININISQ